MSENLLSSLNESQKVAAQHIDGPMLILAGAGSGKTKTITTRLAYLISIGIDPRSILTLTFTNKAANEMSERIYKTLLTLGDDEAYLSAIVEQSGLSKQDILGKKSFLVKSFSSATLSIFTIDKFVNKIFKIIFFVWDIRRLKR